jgi:predicted TIM-barrel fold metal-dependent hydrolase
LIEDLIIVDGHVHSFQNRETANKVIEAFNRVYTIEFKNPGTSDIDDLQGEMRKSHIDYAVLANFTTPRHLINNNNWTLEVCNREKSLIPLISFHPEMEENKEVLFSDYIKRGARGIKLHPMAQGFNPDDSKLYGLYSICAELKLPVVFHSGRVANARLNEFSDLDSIQPILERFPDMPVVLTHMVHGNVEDCLKVARDYKNVYFDTSIVVTGYSEIAATNEPSWLDDGMVIDVFNKIGEDRIIFGSDYPWGSMYDDLQRMKNMNISKDKLKAIMGGNAMKLFRINKEGK